MQDLRCDKRPGAPRGAMVPLQTSPQADLQSGLVLSHVAVSFAPRFCTVESSPGVRVGSLPSDPSDVEAGFSPHFANEHDPITTVGGLTDC